MHKYRNKAALWSAIISLIFLFASTISAQEHIGPVSEENRPAACSNGFVLKGIICSGAYCDNKILICEQYQNGVDTRARHRWSKQFSEERPGYDLSMTEFVSGLACSGSYCDNIRLRYISGNLRNTQQCQWTAFFSEEAPSSAQCDAGKYVAGLKCSGAYCDNLSLFCCSGN